jgi:predicted ATPase
MQKPIKLKRLELAGYKSISPQGQSVEFGDVTLLLGANGSGKAI